MWNCKMEEWTNINELMDNSQKVKWTSLSELAWMD